MMQRAILLVVLALLAGACDRQTPEDKAREDARAVAMVEKAQDQIPPAVRLDPQPISFADVQANNLFGAGCAFIPASTGAKDPVLYADARRAVMKVEGNVVQFASDSGSAEMPYATRDHYVGKALDLRLRKDPGEGTPAGEEAMRWPGSVRITDGWNREVYTAVGAIECGA